MAAAAAATIPTFLSSSQKNPSALSKLFFSRSPTFKPLFSSSSPSISFSSSSSSLPSLIARANTTPPSTTITATTFHGLCYVLGDNIDTDQIISTEHLTLVPSIPDEYRKLGSLAFCGLPSAAYPIPFVDPNQFQSRYTIIVAGENFGCGSSREHAPVALGASGVSAIVAESYARIFFRNSVATGEVYPVESEGRICEECSTGDVVTVELEENRLINHTTGKEYRLKPIGDAGPVIQAGGIFAYARKTAKTPLLPFFPSFIFLNQVREKDCMAVMSKEWASSSSSSSPHSLLFPKNSFYNSPLVSIRIGKLGVLASF